MNTRNACASSNPMTREEIRAIGMEIATEVLRRFGLEDTPVDTFVESPTVECAVGLVDSDSSVEAVIESSVKSSVEAPIEAVIESSVVFAPKTSSVHFM
ncbi:hypothetical protein MMC16_006011 [Acarospora aff. strigata]|nr:hypothetical protein [Acarospora aff. strigata]